MARFETALTRVSYGHPFRDLEQYFASVKHVFPCPFCNGDITYEGYLDRQDGYYDEVYYMIELDGFMCPHCQKKMFCKIQVC